MKYLSHILVGLLVFLLTYFSMNRCTEYKPIVEIQKEIVIKDSIITKEKEVIKWKKLKGEIKYDTIFDTLTTKETIYINLIKCDSVVKVDNIIIADQDTIIEKHKTLIELKEKEIKRQKRKTFFTKVVAGVAIIVTILLLK
jgi:hypothetical protein